MDFNMDMLTFIVLSLACFRLTHLIVSDVITAPFRAIFVEEIEEPDAEGRMNKISIPKLPKWKAFIGTLIACPWCMGFWVGLALVVGWYYIPNIVFPIAAVFAIAGVGAFLETISRYWLVNTYSPTKEQLEKFEELKRQFFEEEPKKDEKKQKTESAAS